MNGIKEYWYSLGARERALLMIGICAVTLMLVWALVLDPVNQRLTQLRTQVPLKQNALNYMRSEQGNLATLRETQQPRQFDDSQPLLTVIEQTAAQSNLRSVINRIQPDEEDSVKVWLNDAYFDPWVQWVETLKQQGIEVTESTVNRGKDDTVSVRVTFQRG